MPFIRPISELTNHADELSEFCHTENQPVFITKDGKGDLVVMSQAYYARLWNLLEPYQKLGEAEKLNAGGKLGITHSEMMTILRERIHASKGGYLWTQK